MTPVLIVLTIVAIAFAVALANSKDPPSGDSPGQWINDYAHNEAVREARLRRLQRW